MKDARHSMADLPLNGVDELHEFRLKYTIFVVFMLWMDKSFDDVKAYWYYNVNFTKKMQWSFRKHEKPLDQQSTLR